MQSALILFSYVSLVSQILFSLGGSYKILKAVFISRMLDKVKLPFLSNAGKLLVKMAIISPQDRAVLRSARHVKST